MMGGRHDRWSSCASAGKPNSCLRTWGASRLTDLSVRSMEMRTFLRLAVALSAALCRLYERGLIHKDIKPANVLVSSATDQVVLSFILLVLRAHHRYRVVIGVGGRASSMGRRERFSRGNSD
jgi:serine/threonine protein kinase